MYRVLIVDDEQPVIESISFMLQKYRPELEIAGTGMSGREAIEIAEATKPDIILIDVKMPGIDGLEALREIKRRSPNVLPILTTAYERFDIAQTAFELGVQDYILKPFSREKLISAVDAAVVSLDQRLDGRGESLKHIELYHTLSSSIETLLFVAVKLNSEVNAFIPYLKSSLAFKTSRGCVGILEWQGQRSRIAADSISFGREVISKLKFKFPCLAAPFEQEVLFFFPDISEVNSVPGVENLAAVVDPEKNSNTQWHFVTGKSVEFESINSSYLDAREAMMSAVEPYDTEQLISYSEQWRRQLEAALQNWDEGLQKQIFTEVLTYTDHIEKAESVLCDLLLYVEHVNSVVTGYHFIRSSYAGEGKNGTAEELFAFYSGWAHSIADKIKTVQAENLPKVLSRALDYIKLNYSHPLQLSDVADQVEVSSAYLSNLFSRYLRKSFIDQLTQIRMEKAKRLLKEHTHSIKEISSLVGYQDPNYFSRLFKRLVGCSPTEFD
ncbi:MAG: response regulator [Spirochaetaceae bacterium]|nr:response regulator [Spirochaetaceae bacterium]MCF7949925.1 response regulator [Spirochaetia bacterium]MCF7951657.1 response regulator [Spirochaetaceae bacterium]